jgi:septal ring factor EnvC (AmiA/AmiB activator)
MAGETKKCDVCDQEIGASETKCPKCGVEFEVLEEEIGVVTRAMTVSEKRKAREKEKADKEEAARKEKEEKEHPKPPEKKSIFRSLGKAVKK